MQGNLFSSGPELRFRAKQLHLGFLILDQTRRRADWVHSCNPYRSNVRIFGIMRIIYRARGKREHVIACLFSLLPPLAGGSCYLLLRKRNAGRTPSTLQKRFYCHYT